MRRVAYAVVAIVVAWNAKASWLPVFSPNFIQLRPGESTTISAQGAWFGISLVPFIPMTFAAADSNVAAVSGSLPTTQPATVQVAALHRGLTRLGVAYGGEVTVLPTSPIIVVADQRLAVRIGTNDPLVAGQPITLTASSDDPDASYVWYGSRPGSGLTIWQIGSGPTATVVPSGAFVHEYWVLMTSPRGAGTATIALEVRPAPRRRRATSH